MIFINFRPIGMASAIIVCLVLGALFFVAFAFFPAYARPVGLLLYAKLEARKSPELWAVPQPLERSAFKALAGKTFSYFVPAQTVDATLAWSVLAGVWKPKVFLGR